MGKKKTDGKSWAEVYEEVAEECQLNTKAFKEWFMARKDLGGFLFNSWTYKRCYLIWERLHNHDEDHVWIADGIEGSGKSFHMIQLCSVVDPTFNIKRICYTLEEFKKLVRHAKRGEAILIDEGSKFVYSRETMSKENRQVTKIFQLMRQKGLFVGVCIPRFWKIDSEIRERAESWSHMFGKEKGYKGKFTIFNKKALDEINKYGKNNFFKTMKIIKRHKMCFRGYGNNIMPTTIDNEEYKKLKLTDFDSWLDEGIKDEQEFIRLPKFSQITGISPKTLGRWCAEDRLNCAKVGRIWVIHRSELENIREKGTPRV